MGDLELDDAVGRINPVFGGAGSRGRKRQHGRAQDSGENAFAHGFSIQYSNGAEQILRPREIAAAGTGFVLDEDGRNTKVMAAHSAPVRTSCCHAGVAGVFQVDGVRVTNCNTNPGSTPKRNARPFPQGERSPGGWTGATVDFLPRPAEETVQGGCASLNASSGVR